MVGTKVRPRTASIPNIRAALGTLTVYNRPRRAARLHPALPCKDFQPATQVREGK